MQNVEIAKILSEYADLLEIQGGNPYRVRSYRRAAQTVEGLSRPVSELVAENGSALRNLPGIGERMVEHLREIVEKGELSELEKIQRELPGSMAEMVHLDGLGPKRAKQVHDELGIDSVDELKKAIDDERIASLSGFGEKTAKKIRRAIEQQSARSKRFRLSEADQLLHPLLEHLRKGPGLQRLEVAGSYRRRQETVGDADILVIAKQAKKYMDHFRGYKGIERVESAGKTKATVFLKSGPQVDLRIVPERSYGAALHYFTGSRAHNVAVRKMGIERGLKINEYGVFRVRKGKRDRRVGGAAEEEVFEAVDLPWIPPELRTDRGEIQAAQNGELPNLIELDDIRGDLHMHSKWTDGGDSIEEMARAAKKRKYRYCAITDHSKATRVAGGLNAKEFRRQRREIEKVRGKVQGIHILAGAEVDILEDGSLDLPDSLLEELDFVIASIHAKLNLDKKAMTRRVVKAVSHPAVNVLGHPSSRRLPRRESISIDMEEVFRAAKDNNVALELNAQPERLDLPDVQARRAAEVGVKIIINTDAHSAESLRYMRYGVDQARRAWLEKSNVRNTASWSQFKRWLDRSR